MSLIWAKRMKERITEMSSRPPSGSMVHWRFKNNVPGQVRGPWRFGYVTYLHGPDLMRMGLHNGDTNRGEIVTASEIEWKVYR